MTAAEPMIRAHDVGFAYGSGRTRREVLSGVSLELERGALLAVTGPSGSGKSTLLALLGGLERVGSGCLVVDGQDLGALDARGLSAYRRERVGFVFQSFHLLPGLTVLENVLAGLEPLRLSRREGRERAQAALSGVGLAGLEGRLPHELSGGEQQRVAVARALAKDPPLLLADEPTGNLDAEAAARVLAELESACGQGRAQRTVVIVSHDAEVVARARRVVKIHDGRLVERTPASSR